MSKKIKNNNNSDKELLNIGLVSTRRFWKLSWEEWTGGYDGGDYTGIAIFWGTWYEAAREVIKNDECCCKPKWRRKIEPFELPDVSRKRKSFYVC
jgi:hypothetical protein